MLGEFVVDAYANIDGFPFLVEQTTYYIISSTCNALINLEGFIAYNPQKSGILNDQYKYTKN